MKCLYVVIEINNKNMKGLSQIYTISLSKSGSLKSPHRMNIFLYDCNKTEILLLFKTPSYTQNSRGWGGESPRDTVYILIVIHIHLIHF